VTLSVGWSYAPVMDEDVIKRIDQLIDEEHRLYDKSSTGNPLSDDDDGRLRELEVQLDQCWDLLRQRRAMRDAGQDASGAKSRPADVVEGYQQ
jgi:hypothetical protein